MALVPCTNCGTKLLSDADKCHKCGRPTAKTRRVLGRDVVPWHELSRGKKALGVFGFFAIVALIVIAAASGHHRSRTSTASSSPSTGGLPLSQSQFLDELKGNFSDGTLLKKGALVVTDFGTDKISVRYTYSASTPHMTAAEAEVITKGLVKFSIDVLIGHGYNPRQHTTLIGAHAYQPSGKSVTGASQLRTYGWASYDWNNDRIEFDPASE